MKKEMVYLVRGKGGEYALGTKICASKSGAKNSLNSFVCGLIDHKIRTEYPGISNPMDSLNYLHRWFFSKKNSPMGNWNTLKPFLQTTQLNLAKVTEQDYDEFIRIVREIYDYWDVEGVEQNDHCN